MTRWFEAHTIARYGRYRVVEPTIVVEIAFDVIVRSNRHKSGFALRFPRIATCAPTSRPPRSTPSRPSRPCTKASSTAPSCS